MFQTTFRNRAAVGADFASLRHDCRIAFQGRDDPDPASFDHRGWIAATWTGDGKTVFAIVHDEYHGERFGAACGAESGPLACWYNALTAAVSRDGGASFEAVRPRRLVAAVPFRAEETRDGHAGYFEPTNIVAHDGALFMMANVVSPPPQRAGNCLLRTTGIEDPAGWRAFRDGGFPTRFADPYAGAVDGEAQLCDPIAPDVLRWPVTSLVRHVPSGLFVATMKGRTTDGDGRERTGVFYATSRDLIDWRGPALLFEAPIAGDCAAPATLAYPALIDTGSESRNFDTLSGDRATLTFVRTHRKACKDTPDRDVAMRPVRITVP
ncbi:hypothetical protein F6X38_14160 [Aureimonas leprariae]|uniref:Glycosyl hydrolase family 32 N-terminal domain-containing protein n=1 Tax=Plantimonas leprariae TaxID=2615207 RepID=A0A7V7TW47_9HYPH|nr:hypothetical protein F6X38_14160 [Aureimonas leprariae]